MKIDQMKRKDFESLPHWKWDEEIEFRSMVILPGRSTDLHDSGYRLMDFAAVNNDYEAFCLLSGCSDLIALDGIGGYGYRWQQKYVGVPQNVSVAGWIIDCLPKSGLLHIRNKSGRLKAGLGLGLLSFNLYSMPKEEE